MLGEVKVTNGVKLMTTTTAPNDEQPLKPEIQILIQGRDGEIKKLEIEKIMPDGSILCKPFEIDTQIPEVIFSLGSK